MPELTQAIVNVVLDSEDFADLVKTKFDEYIDEDTFENRVVDIIKDNREDYSLDSAEVKDIIDEHIGSVDEIREEMTRINVDNIALKAQLIRLAELVEGMSVDALEDDEDDEDYEPAPQKSRFIPDVLSIAFGVVTGQIIWAWLS